MFSKPQLHAVLQRTNSPYDSPKAQDKDRHFPGNCTSQARSEQRHKTNLFSPTHSKEIDAGRAYSQREPFPENPGDAACSDFRRGLRRKKTGSGSAGKGLSHKRQELQRYVLDTAICLIFLNIKRLLIPDAFFARTQRFSKFSIHRQFFYSQH